MTPKSRKPRPSKGGPAPAKLPRFGLAEDILKDEAAAGPVPPRQEPPLTGPDRIFAFADSLQLDQAEAPKEVEHPKTWVTFKLGRETFALPVTHVHEILRVDTITRVPHAPAPIRGVTNLRGRILPVVDLRTRIGLPVCAVDEQSRVMVMSAEGRIIGLLVDGVEQVIRIKMSAVLPPPPDVMTDQSYYLLGIFQEEGEMVILLNVETVLTLRDSAEKPSGGRS